jgi:hypothetical protein
MRLNDRSGHNLLLGGSLLGRGCRSLGFGGSLRGFGRLGSRALAFTLTFTSGTSGTLGASGANGPAAPVAPRGPAGPAGPAGPWEPAPPVPVPALSIIFKRRSYRRPLSRRVRLISSSTSLRRASIVIYIKER